MAATQLPTVAEIAAGSLGAVRVFEKHGIDYCCGGKRPLEEVCAEKGLNAEQLREEIQRESAGNAPSRDWTRAPLAELVHHIVSTHHEYLRSELPRLNAQLDKVYRIYGEKDAATLSELPALFGGLRAELESHIGKEEMILFPAIVRYEQSLQAGQPLPFVPFGSVANPIRMMEHEHDGAGDALGRMREVTRNYVAPEHACVTYRSLLAGLEQLERDTHMHIHLENNILFPRAIQLEAQNR